MKRIALLLLALIAQCTAKVYTGNVRIMENDYTRYIEVGDHDIPFATIASGEDADVLISQLGLATGDVIEAEFDEEGNYYNNTIVKKSHTQDTLKSSNITAVFFIIETCNWKNPFSHPDNLTKYLFSGLKSQEDNIQTYYDICGYNKLLWHPDNVAVIGPISVNCTGTIRNGALSYTYDASKKCSAAEQFAWRNSGEKLAEELAKTDPKLARILNTVKRRHVALLPKEVKCGWAGLGSVGCSGKSCSTYIKGTAATDMSVYFHELGHNMGLSHAGRGYDEYGDQTDVMGNSANKYIQKILCFNAGNMYRVGLNNAIYGGNLTSEHFSVISNHKQFTIPATSYSDNNYVSVDLGRYNMSFYAPYPKYFISYRSKHYIYGGYDAALQGKYHKKVYIHAFNGTYNDRDYNRTLLVDYGSPFGSSNNDTWTGPFVPMNTAGIGGGLRVRVLSQNDRETVVDVCKMFSQKEVCSMVLDLDCDNRYGMDDPDCVPLQ